MVAAHNENIISSSDNSLRSISYGPFVPLMPAALHGMYCTNCSAVWHCRDRQAGFIRVAFKRSMHEACSSSDETINAQAFAPYRRHKLISQYDYSASSLVTSSGERKKALPVALHKA